MSTKQDSDLPPQVLRSGGSPLAEAAVRRLVWHDFRSAWRALVLFEVCFKLLEAWLFVPLVALILSAALSQAGHAAVSNGDVLDFLRSPSGLLYAALFSTGVVAMLLWKQAGLMGLVAGTDSVEHPPLTQLLRVVFWKAYGVAQLGIVKAALLALTLAPFVLLIVGTYFLLLSVHDINYYLTVRPPIFWLAGGIGALLLLAALVASMVLYVRLAFALPILLFEQRSVRAALRASRERVRGASWRIGVLLFGWPLTALLLGAPLEAGFRVFAAAVLANAGEHPMGLILLLLAAQGGLLAALSFVVITGQALLTRRLYLLRSEQLDSFRRDELPTAPDTEKPTALWIQRLAYVCLAIILLTPLALCANWPRQAASRPLVRVTAHRGHSHAAPENTLNSIRKAIESGADYAEVDVQQTADGAVVLLHDRDFKRVAYDPRKIEELSYDEVRKLDVGSWFDASFAGERVPTLAESIDLCRGRIKMNIELKFYGPDRQLAPAVARLVHAKEFETDCLVTSFDYDALQEMKHHNPRLRTGLTVAYALGDVSRLEVEALSVRADWLSERVLRAAHQRGKEVHVWTVNDARRMAQLMQRGVDNIITDDPDLLIRVRGEWESRTESERLLLASRLLLGLDPWDASTEISATNP
jgi:glycerophosphoryl diester phosphodiesterase